MFTPLHTQRLLLRPFTLDDVPEFLERRNDPEVALSNGFEPTGRIVEEETEGRRRLTPA